MNGLYKNFMNLAQLFDSVFLIYKKSFVYQLLFSLLTLAITFAAFILMSIIFFAGGLYLTFGSFNYITGRYEGLSSYITLFSALIPFGVLLAFIRAFASSGGIALTRQVFCDERLSVSSALKTALRSIWRVFTVIIAESIVLIPLLLLFFWLALAMLRPFDAFSYSYGTPQSIMTNALSVIALLALLIFSVYTLIHICFMVAVPVAMFEKKSLFSALIKSFRLIRRNYFKLLAATLLWVCVVWMMQRSILLISDLLFVVIGTLDNSFGGSSSVPGSPVLGYVLTFGTLASSTVMSILITPLSNIFTGTVYFNQKIKHEGLDIEIGLEKLRGTESERHWSERT